MDLGARLGSDVPLGQFQRLELPDALKTSGSFGLIDDVDVTLVPGDATTPAGAKITVHLKLPDFLSYGGISLEGAVTLLATTDGSLILDDFTIGPLDADLGGVGLTGQHLLPRGRRLHRRLWAQRRRRRRVPPPDAGTVAV
jgi:hypothetical protein